MLVLCVDRDDDLGRKTGINAPVLGKKDNLEAARALGSRDPLDSDLNAIYQAVNIYQQLKEDERAFVATVAGDARNQLKGDQRIVEQLEQLKDDLGVNEVILVTDGLEDENILPLVRSIFKIRSLNRAIVKQSKQLESSYFMIKDFVGDIVDNPEMARIFLGAPAIALLIYALFGGAGWRLILGALGAYLLVKGFSLEGKINNVMQELKRAAVSRRASLFLYVLGAVFIVAGAGVSYNNVLFKGYSILFNKVMWFLRSFVYYLYVSGIFLASGKVISERDRSLVSLFSVYIGIGLAISLLVSNTASFLLIEEFKFMDLIYVMALSSGIVAVTLLLERWYSA